MSDEPKRDRANADALAPHPRPYLRGHSNDASAPSEPLSPLRPEREGKIGPSKNRLLQRSRPPNRKLFDARAKRRFLEVFAATANARMGAQAAGVAYQTVFKHRARDGEFASAWEDALAQGYARLEAEVLAAALGPSSFGDEDEEEGQALLHSQTSFRQAQDERVGLGGREEGDSSDDVAPHPCPSPEGEGRMTVEQKLMILREYRRGFGAGRRAPSARPVVASQEEAIAALAKRLANFAVRGRLVVPVVDSGGGSDGGGQEEEGRGPQPSLG